MTVANLKKLADSKVDTIHCEFKKQTKLSIFIHFILQSHNHIARRVIYKFYH